MVSCLNKKRKVGQAIVCFNDTNLGFFVCFITSIDIERS